MGSLSLTGLPLVCWGQMEGVTPQPQCPGLLAWGGEEGLGEGTHRCLLLLPWAATALLQSGSCPAFSPVYMASPVLPFWEMGESETESESQVLGGRRKTPAVELTLASS